MTLRDIPIIPTILVAAAIATMIALGFWQLGRVDEKAALIARYEAALANPDPIAFPRSEDGEVSDDTFFRQSSLECLAVRETTSIAGNNANRQSGLVHIVTCDTPIGINEFKVGFSRDPKTPDWDGGLASGLIAPGGVYGVRLQLEEPIAGLESLAQPDPKDLPNNHLAYAGQWFFFALTALVIYMLALRRRKTRT